MRYLWLLALVAAGNLFANSEIELNVGKSLVVSRVPHSEVEISIDGQLDESAWKNATEVTDFLIVDPDTLEKPRWSTKLLMIYTEKGIYAAFDMEQPPETIISVLSPHDTGVMFGDFVGFTLDTSGEGKYGYWVSLAASGVKTDGTLMPESQFKREWDGVWYGETKTTKKGWIAELFIPWSQLAMPRNKGDRKMALFASRRVAAIGERWGVPALPFTITKWIQHMRPIELIDVDPQQQWSLIPYASSTFDQVTKKTKLRAGAEIFWRPSSNFQLSGTALPDFGNVESDDVIVNLSALETFLPDKRLFFLEGRDIFFTSPRSDNQTRFFPVTIVNTKRIGGAPRMPTLPPGVTLNESEKYRQVELNAAVKATGQIGSVRYGILGANESDISFRTNTGKIKQSGSDYGAARFIWEQNKEGSYRALGLISTLTHHSEEDAVVHGLDYHYLSSNGKWKLDGQVLYSNKDSVGEGWGALADVVYSPKRGLRLDMDLAHFSDKLEINDLGFLQRNDVSRGGISIDYTQPKLSWAHQLNLNLKTMYEINGDGDTTRRGFSASGDFLMNNLSRFRTSVLLYANRIDDLESFGNGKFVIPSRWEFMGDFFSDSSKRISYRVGLNFNQEKIGGHAVKARAALNLRLSQRMKAEIFAEYVKRDGWLLHQENKNFTSFQTIEWRPRLAIDYFFTARQQLRLSAQWVAIKASENKFFRIPANISKLIPSQKPDNETDNFAISNLSVQLRYRWEIAPLSDLFVVYSLSGATRQQRLGFSDLLKSSYKNPIAEQFVIKLRYRLGS